MFLWLELKFEKRGPGAGGPTAGTTSGLDLRHASIDGKLHAGNVRTFIGGEKHHGSRNFFRLTSPTERNLRDKLLGSLLGLFGSEARFLKRLSFDWSGAYRITRILRSFSSMAQPR